jgi:UDP-N-acetylglucosamine 2-epimerase (non-hydrolysing)
MVYGDVDSTVAAAWAAARLGVPVAHVESGLRSFDRTMPEENNRIIVDQLASIHFVTEPAGSINLLKEGHKESIYSVGNTMIDSLKRLQDSMQLRRHITNRILLTCHRPSNVDDVSFFNDLYLACQGISLPILWPIHPRTKKSLKKFNLYESFRSLENMSIVDPMDYATFLKEMSESAAVITDSGGIQEETTYLNIPCLTIRKNTERPITIKEGSNTLVSVQSLPSHIKSVEAGTYKSAKKIVNWDGLASHRICDTLEGLL